AVGGDLLDEHLGRTAVDLLPETLPVLLAAPASYGVRLHPDAGGDLDAGRHFPGQEQSTGFFTDLRQVTFHGLSPSGSVWLDWRGRGPSGPGRPFHRWRVPRPAR